LGDRDDNVRGGHGDDVEEREVVKVLIVSTIHDEHIGMSTIVSERAGTRPDQVVQVARLWVVLGPEKELLLRQSSEQRLNGCVCV